jgi:GH24 family phage-related lysozyme (muramidase)
MKTGKQGRKLIRQFEGCRLEAYRCPAGVWTIGIGHTGKVGNAKICEGMKISVKQCDELFTKDLEKFEREVEHYDKIYHFNQNEFDALVSFAFNIGNINQLTSGGTRTRETIARKMLLYNKSAGVVLAGLTRRRKAEQELFIREVTQA